MESVKKTKKAINKKKKNTKTSIKNKKKVRKPNRARTLTVIDIANDYNIYE